MRRWIRASVSLWAALVLTVTVIAGCGAPARELWQDKGFESEADCWLHYGWDGTIEDGMRDHSRLDFYCGPR